MMNESIKFNDGNGTNDTATYLGPVLYDDILKHKIRQSDDADYLVYRENISSLTVPEISNVTISVKQYASEINKLKPEQLKNIANSDNLDNDQQDIIERQSNINHLTFPTMMKLLEKGRIDKSFAKLKYRLPECMS